MLFELVIFFFGTLNGWAIIKGLSETQG